MEIVLYGTIFCLTGLSLTTSYYTYKFAMLILDLQDDIEESLDELDENFKSLNKILAKPIFFDSIEVRQCITEIKKTRNTVIKIAERLTSFGANNNMIKELTDRDESQEEDI